MILSHSKYGTKVFDKYGLKCWYCGILLNEKNKSIDHLEPQKYGRNEHIDNLRPCCRTCNTIKSSSDIETFRLRMRAKKAELPKFISTTILRYLEDEHGFVIELPEHEFYYETMQDGESDEMV